MDRSKFYAALRKRDNRAFGASLTKGQVEAMEAILDECAACRCDLGQTAYILATAHGETGGHMGPREENLKYSAGRLVEVFSASRRQGIPASKLAYNPKLLANTVYGGAWGKKNLGNIHPDDGWNFRGRGPQTTGRRNYGKWGRGLGLPLLTNPDLLMQLDVHVKALVRPMMEGWATGKKLDDFVVGDRRDYRSARQVWNGMFEAAHYAQLARYFESALEAGRWKVLPTFIQPDVEPPITEQPSARPDLEPVLERPNTSRSVWAALAAILNAIFGRKTK